MQRRINFGSFPDDFSADAIRTAFQKSEENFTEIYSGINQAGVTTINKIPGAGVTVSAISGNVVVTANIANVRMTTSTLKMGVGSNASTSADLSRTSQTIYVDLPTVLTATNLKTLTGNVVFSTAAAPNVGDVLTATSSTAAAWQPPSAYNFDNQTGTTFNPVLGDELRKMITLNNAAPIQVLVPNNASQAFSIGSTLDFLQIGVGQVTFAGDTGVTVHSAVGPNLRVQFSGASLVKGDTNIWYLNGDLAA